MVQLCSLLGILINATVGFNGDHDLFRGIGQCKQVYLFFCLCINIGAVPSWLVRSSLDLAVLVRVVAEDIVLCC